MPRLSPAVSEARFWEKVDRSGECWLWTGQTTEHPTHPYGVLRRDGRRLRAHRFAWELTHGPVPDGLLVCHSCDVTPCVRPDHLFLGTNQDNTQDMLAKERHGTERVHGSDHHKAVLSEDDVRRIRSELGSRSLGSLATEYGVSKGLVWQISAGRIWKHVR